MRTPSAGGAGNLWEQACILLFLERLWHPGLWEASEGTGSAGRGSGMGLASHIAVVLVATGAAEEGRAHQNSAETGPFLSSGVLGPRPRPSAAQALSPSSVLLPQAWERFLPVWTHCPTRPANGAGCGQMCRRQGPGAHEGPAWALGTKEQGHRRPNSTAGDRDGGHPRPLPQLCRGDCARVASQGPAPAPAHAPHRNPTW